MEELMYEDARLRGESVVVIWDLVPTVAGFDGGPCAVLAGGAFWWKERACVDMVEKDINMSCYSIV
jgi:hypothetical protein